MAFFILALVIAAIICGVMWRRPDARAAMSGAWQAGKAQAVREFRDGYDFAQQRLRRGDPSWKNPRRWLSWGLAGAFGAATTVAAANRIRREAWRGARERYRDWKDAQPVDAEIVAEQNGQVHTCLACGTVEVTWRFEMDPPGWYCASCATPAPDPDPRPDPDPAPEPDPDPHHPSDPDPEPDDHPWEDPPVQTEAAGLTSYANAHTELANELQSRMAGIESLAASMSDVLAEHSDLIGNSAVMQDLLNQAAGVAQQTAAQALQVANN
jgi:hypothetical protein